MFVKTDAPEPCSFNPCLDNKNTTHIHTDKPYYIIQFSILVLLYILLHHERLTVKICIRFLFFQNFTK